MPVLEVIDGIKYMNHKIEECDGIDCEICYETLKKLDNDLYLYEQN